MRTFILLGIVFLTLTACEINVIDPTPPYDFRNAIVGSYEMNEYSETYNDYLTYYITISKSSYSGYQVYLNNFYDAEISISAYADGNKITIPYQVVNGYEVEGVGTISGNTIYFSYRVRDTYNNTATDFCKTTAQRTY
ncbi:MAG TPA: hypothetical protein VIM65_24050 [Cyclobacteriaceae bacterium]